jgi:hypothetical protein
VHIHLAPIGAYLIGAGNRCHPLSLGRT